MKKFQWKIVEVIIEVKNIKKMETGNIEVSIDEIVVVKVNRDENRDIHHIMRQNYSYSSSTDITSEEFSKFGKSIVSKLKTRQYTCGSDLKEMIDQEVTLIGWVDLKTVAKFIQLRDGYGIVQCVLPDNNPLIESTASLLESKSILQVTGIVTLRPQPRVKNLQFYVNGGIEIKVSFLQVLITDNELQTDALEDATGPKNIVSGVCKYTNRTHTCGELRSGHAGTKVRLFGWLKSWRSPRFFSVEDAYGLTQCIIPEKFSGVDLSQTPIETVLEVEGIVNARPPSTIANKYPTGDIEVFVNSVTVLNAAPSLPFKLQQQRPDDATFYKHRYLGLRLRELQNNLRMRSTISMNIRKFLIDLHGFIEVETPTLTAKTPGDLSEFIVPSRQVGHFYSLAQNTEQFCQMLMTGGVDRCFQFARCFRCDKSNPVQQLEFTQLELELSFSEMNDIINLTEDLLFKNFPMFHMVRPFQRLSYQQALDTYGSDEPDISYGLKLQNITDLIKDSLGYIADDFGAYILIIRKTDGQLSLHFNDLLKETIVDQYKDINFLHYKITESTDYFKIKDVSKDINRNVIKSLVNSCHLEKNDMIYISYGHYQRASSSLGECRTAIAKLLESQGKLIKNIDENYQPIWITDLPLFVKDKLENFKSFYHPSSAPMDTDMSLLDENTLKGCSLSYHLVIRGQKVARGSVRIHSAQLQEAVFNLLKVPPTSIAHILRALKSGCPPHAGISLDMDSLVAMACNESSVREVIAFPKMEDGHDLVTGAPNSLSTDEIDSCDNMKIDMKETSAFSDTDSSPSSKRLKMV